MQNRREFLVKAGLMGLAGITGCALGSKKNNTANKPNIIIIFTDDQGYGDAACYGAKDIKTPNIDKLAADGIKLTDFYVAAPVCTPSRAALLTGCYPKRVGLHKAVIFPQDNHGLNPNEQLLPELLKNRGYSSACVGKWHLGHHKPMLPNTQGFDHYYGLPYSNDMCHLWFQKRGVPKGYPKLPFYDNEKVIEVEPDQRYLTKRYTENACQWITDNKDKPFFLYLAHSMPHVPWYRSEEFENASDRGVYGDVIQEIDHSVGQIVKKLKELNLSDNTLIIFTSDNGGASWNKNGASNAPLRGSKGNTWEGGLRVPCIMKYPARLPAGQICQEFVSAMDIVPTICKLTGSKLPQKKIDGNDICHILKSPGKSQPPRPFLYYARDGQLEAIRWGKWKLHWRKEREMKNNHPFPLLYDLRNDISEKVNIAPQNPQIVEKLKKMATEMDAEITKNARKVMTVQ